MMMRTETKHEQTEVQQNVEDNRKMVIQVRMTPFFLDWKALKKESSVPWIVPLYLGKKSHLF